MDMLTSLGITKDLLADLIINIASIVVLFVIVKKLAYKPVKRFMDERAQRLSEQKEQAAQLNEQANKKIEECNVILAQSEQAKSDAIAEAEAVAHKESEQIIADAKRTAEEIVRKANVKAQEDYQRVMEEANDHIINLAMEASSVLLKRTIADEDNKKIVEDFLNSIDGDKNA